MVFLFHSAHVSEGNVTALQWNHALKFLSVGFRPFAVNMLASDGTERHGWNGGRDTVSLLQSVLTWKPFGACRVEVIRSIDWETMGTSSSPFCCLASSTRIRSHGTTSPHWCVQTKPLNTPARSIL